MVCHRCRRLRIILMTTGGYGVRDAHGRRSILVDTLLCGQEVQERAELLGRIQQHPGVGWWDVLG
jgi:hypothetical protein